MSSKHPDHRPEAHDPDVSEARFRAFADHIADAYYLHDEDGVVMDVNRRACEMLGYSREELIGMKPEDLDTDVAHRAGQFIRTRLDAGKEARFDTYHRRKDGSVFPVEVRLFPYRESGRMLRLAQVSDISERKRTEDTMLRMNRELRAITVCHQTLLRAQDEKCLLDEVCRIICDEAGYLLAWVGYAEHDEAKSIVPMGVAGNDQGYLDRNVRSHFTWSEDSEYGRGGAGEAIRSGEIVYIANIATDPRVALWRERALERGFGSVLCLPMKDQEQAVFGVMLVYAGQIDGFNGDDRRLMADLTRDLAFGIAVLRDRNERKRAEGSLQALNRELQAISRCHQVLLRAEDEQELLDDICRIIVEEAGYRMAWVGFVEHDEARSIRTVASAGYDDGYVAGLDISWSGDVDQGQGPAGIAARSGRSVYTEDIAHDPSMARWRERALKRGYLSNIGIPLKQAETGEVFGVLSIYASEPNAFVPEEIQLLEDLTRDLGFGISVLRDRDERKRAEGSLRNINRELGAISLCHQTLLRADVEQELLDDICRIVVEEAGYRMAWVGFVEHDEAKSIRPVSWAGFDSGYIKDAALSWDEGSPYGQGPTGIAVRTGDIVHAQDIATDPRMAPWRERALERGYHSSIVLALKNKGGQVFGVLTIYASKPYAISSDEVRLLGELADDMAFGIGVLRMRTARDLAEESLRQNEEKYRTIFENSVLGIFRSTFAGHFVELNPAMAQMLGYDSPETAMREIRDIGRQVYAEGYDREQMMKMQLGMQGDAAQYIHRYCRRDGSEFDANLYLKTVRNAEGEPIMLEGIVEDITESRRAEEERQRLESQLVQAQKMESIGRLAGGVAHDFNNMLGAIMGYSDLALSRIDPDERVHAYVQEVRKAADRSAALTRQLLAFARKQSVAPRVLDLNETVEGMLNMLRRLIGEDVRLDWLPGEGLWPVEMDPSQVDQVLANLCVNARDAIDGIGSITIRTRNIELGQSECCDQPEFTPGAYVCLDVGDDGCGMDADTRESVFEPFFTTKGEGKGTGLGLSTVYGIVKQNNGCISIDSQPGKGTTFHLFLPRHSGMAEAMPTRQGGRRGLSRGHETILLVEDETALLRIMKLMLKECGYDVLVAASPAEAIAMATERAGAGKIDLLITDMVMPEMNGRDLARDLGFLYPGLRCLFMSGYTDNTISREGVLDSGIDFIQKPFAMEDLAAKAREVLDGD